MGSKITPQLELQTKSQQCNQVSPVLESNSLFKLQIVCEMAVCSSTDSNTVFELKLSRKLLKRPYFRYKVMPRVTSEIYSLLTP